MVAPTRKDRVQTLRSLVQLLVDTSETVIKEWEREDQHPVSRELPSSSLPSHKLFEARRVFRGACEMALDIVQDPRLRIQELAETFTLTQSFDTTLRASVPDILAEAPGGFPSAELSRRTGINEMKLVRVMRLLCSAGLYEEVGTERFANTSVTRVLVGNAPAKAYPRLFSTKFHSEAVQYLPDALLDPEITDSSAPNETAFQKAHGSNKTMWDFTEDSSEEVNEKTAEIRELFPLAMVGQGQTYSPALVADFPWSMLGNATVVDVGGGVGSMCLDLAKAFPDLHFVVQDLPATIEKAYPIWNAEAADAVAAGRVQLQPYDFFEEQPVKGAGAYFLRCVLHDWPDNECVKILRRVRDAMNVDSRLLIADIIVHPPLGSTHLASAPAPLPANYGKANAFKGMRDMWMLALGNGAERTPEQLSAIANKAGLRIEKIWECRGPASITELRLV